TAGEDSDRGNTTPEENNRPPGEKDAPRQATATAQSLHSFALQPLTLALSVSPCASLGLSLALFPPLSLSLLSRSLSLVSSSIISSSSLLCLYLLISSFSFLPVARSTHSRRPLPLFLPFSL